MVGCSNRHPAIFSTAFHYLLFAKHYLGNTAQATVSGDMDHNVDGPTAFGFDISERNSAGGAHGQLGQAPHGILCAVGVDGGERTVMAGIHRIEQRARFTAANLSQDDAVWAVAQSGLQQMIECDGIFMGIGLGLGRKNVRFPDVQFRRVFDDQDTFVLWNAIGQHIEQGGFARAGPARDEDVVATTDSFCQSSCLLFIQHLPFDQVSHREVP